MASCQVAAQKFLPWNSTTVLPFAAAVGFTSMYAMRSGSPWDVKEKYETGQGYSKPCSSGP